MIVNKVQIIDNSSRNRRCCLEWNDRRLLSGRAFNELRFLGSKDLKEAKRVDLCTVHLHLGSFRCLRERLSCVFTFPSSHWCVVAVPLVALAQRSARTRLPSSRQRLPRSRQSRRRQRYRRPHPCRRRFRSSPQAGQATCAATSCCRTAGTSAPALSAAR